MQPQQPPQQPPQPQKKKGQGQRQRERRMNAQGLHAALYYRIIGDAKDAKDAKGTCTSRRNELCNPISFDHQLAMTHGKDIDTILFVGSRIRTIFPSAKRDLTVKMCHRSLAKTVDMNDPQALKLAKIDDDMIIKYIRNEYVAWVELRINRYIQQMFKRAKMVDASCVHPSICEINVTMANQTKAILLPLKRYETNGNRYVAKMPLGPARQVVVMKIIKDVLRTLTVLHKSNVVHLDIKPSNILIPFGYDSANQAQAQAQAVISDYEMCCNSLDLFDKLHHDPRERIIIGTPGSSRRSCRNPSLRRSAARAPRSASTPRPPRSCRTPGRATCTRSRSRSCPSRASGLHTTPPRRPSSGGPLSSSSWETSWRPNPRSISLNNLDTRMGCGCASCSRGSMLCARIGQTPCRER